MYANDVADFCPCFGACTPSNINSDGFNLYGPGLDVTVCISYEPNFPHCPVYMYAYISVAEVFWQTVGHLVWCCHTDEALVLLTCVHMYLCTHSQFDNILMGDLNNVWLCCVL